jgi:hypothetical protein
MRWFGESIMFGKVGDYYVMQFDGDATQTDLRGNYTYTVTLNVNEGGNVGQKSVDPSSF